MNRTVRLSLISRIALTTLGPIALAVVNGCGAGKITSFPYASEGSTAAISGKVYGGQSPIQGGQIVLYHTSATATAYGSGAVVVGTGITGADGSFTIAPSATSANCPAGQQAYITAAGGYPAGNTSLENQNSLQMVALGDCGSISSSTHVIINEVTTVAAAYALSGFITTATDANYTDGLGNAIYAANVGAPAANNSIIGSATASAPSGLAHAFLNALNLVNYNNGVANSVFQAATGGTSTTGAVPQTELFTLGDIMQTCVDSASTLAAVSASCTQLFTDTPSLGGNTPNNTLQAFVNLARNPYPGSTKTADLINLVKPTAAAFQPYLSAAPADWSLAVVYHTGLAAPYFVALDANDTVYLGLTTTSTTLPAVFGIGVYGNSVPVFASPTTGTTTKGIAPDALGNVWVAVSNSSMYRFSTSTGALLSGFTSSVGSTMPVAVDKQNNVWVGHATTTAGVILEQLAYTNVGATGTWTLAAQASLPAASGSYGIAIDANQNVWSASYLTNGTTAVTLPNSGTVGAPVYAGVTTSGVTAISPILSTTVALKPYSMAFDATGNAWYGIYGNSSISTTGIQEVVPNSYTPTVTSTSAQPQVIGSTAGSNGNTLGTTAALEVAMDGAGTLFIPDNTTSGVHMYSTVTSNTLTEAAGLTSAPETVYSVTVLSANQGAGCTSAPAVSFTGTSGSGAAATANVSAGKVTSVTVTSGGSGYVTAPTVVFTGGGCTTAPSGTANVNAIYNPRQIAIDSTGSIWMGFTTGGATQIIGVAAPSYPLLSAGKPGLSPGLTAVNPLP